MFIGYNPVGETLDNVAKSVNWNTEGYCVMILNDGIERYGKRIDEDISLNLILQRHPKYRDYVVKYYDDFFGEDVLRIIHPSLYGG